MSLIYINPYAFGGAATDPNFASVSLLLHGDGTNGSTTITDSSSSSNVITCVGNAQISTAEKKFGTGSLYFNSTAPGQGNKMNFDSQASNFGSNNFTVEAWIYRTGAWNFQAIITTRPTNSGFVDAYYLGTNSAGSLVWYSNATDAESAGGVITTNTWQHVAGTRSGNTLRLFVDGVIVATNSSYTKTPTRTLTGIGNIATNNDEPFGGYIDDLRITKGIARYTAAFTPPTAPFPDA